jgi:hypothetical protein
MPVLSPEAEVAPAYGGPVICEGSRHGACRHATTYGITVTVCVNVDAVTGQRNNDLAAAGQYLYYAMTKLDMSETASWPPGRFVTVPHRD